MFDPESYEIIEEKSSQDNLKEIWASGKILQGNSSGRFFRDYLAGRSSTDGYCIMPPKHKLFTYLLVPLLITGLVVSVFNTPKSVQAQATTLPIQISYIPIPSNSNVINVKNNGVKGDGTTDDTAAIQNIIKSHGGFDTIYFPAGTYLISDTLSAIDGSGNERPYLRLFGESKTNTTIKLADNLGAFQSSSKAMIRTNAGNTAFGNYIKDFTIDTGSGNSKAIGLDYITSNFGSVENVSIKGGGFAGIEMTRDWFGPGLIKNVDITGFDYGLDIGAPHYSATLEDVTLTGQGVAGIRSNGQVVTIRHLNSNNTVPAVINCSCYDNLPRGLTTIIDSNLIGGAASQSAFVNQGENKYFIRNVSTSGYGSSLNDSGNITTDSPIVEKFNGSAVNLFGSDKTSLNLPIEETPTPDLGSPASDWANVLDYGANVTDIYDDDRGIQAAIDSGKKTVYLPHGDYFLQKPLNINHPVNIIGFGAQIRPDISGSYFYSPVPAGANKSVINITGNGTGLVYFQGLNFSSTSNNGFIGSNFLTALFNHQSSMNLVLKNIGTGFLTQWGYLGKENGGNVYFEDYAAGHINLKKGQKAWARQLNVENSGDERNSTPHIRNEGGTLWVLDYKIEAKTDNGYNDILLENLNGSKTEILGGMLYPIQTLPVAIKNIDSDLSINYATNYFGIPKEFATHIQDTQQGVTKEVKFEDLPNRVDGKYMPLYVSKRNVPIINANSPIGYLDVVDRNTNRSSPQSRQF